LNYLYGQGLINLTEKLFFTPKKLSKSKYKIFLNIDIVKNTYSGIVTIYWQNESKLPINRLCINRGIIAESDLTIEEINNTSPDKYGLLFNDSFILIDLQEPVKYNDEFTIKIKFSAELPKSLIYNKDIFEFNSRVAWYPKLYWDEPTGNSYEVLFENITEGYQVFAVGDKNGNTYSENNVANYYGFVVSKKNYFMSAEVRGITVTIVHCPEHKKWAEFMLETAVSALDFFINFIGLYPYKSFIIIPGSSEWDGGGNFSSGIVYIHNFEKYNPENNEYIDYYKAIVPHEIGHQYFWEYVLENEQPYCLGLGLSIALDREYTQYKKNIKSWHKGIIEDYLGNVKAKKNTTIILPDEEAEKALNSDNNEYGDNYQGSVCHGKSFLIMSMLIDIIGKDCFFNVMRHILNTYGGNVLYTYDFIRICEEFSKINLSWFFNKWLKSNMSLSYSLENTTETEKDGIYTITTDVCRDNSLPAPVCVTVFFEDGSSQTKFTERLLSKQTLVFIAKSKHTKITFDTFEVYGSI